MNDDELIQVLKKIKQGATLSILAHHNLIVSNKVATSEFTLNQIWQFAAAANLTRNVTAN